MTILEVTELDEIPTGEYPINVKDIEEEVGQYGQQLKFSLEIINGEFNGRSLTTWADMNASLTGKLAKYAAALGRPLEVGEMFDPNELLGRKCMATVLWSEKKKKPGEWFPKVMDLRIPKKKSGAPAAKPTPVADDPEDVFSEE